MPALAPRPATNTASGTRGALGSAHGTTLSSPLFSHASVCATLLGPRVPLRRSQRNSREKTTGSRQSRIAWFDAHSSSTMWLVSPHLTYDVASSDMHLNHGILLFSQQTSTFASSKRAARAPRTLRIAEQRATSPGTTTRALLFAAQSFAVRVGPVAWPCRFSCLGRLPYLTREFVPSVNISTSAACLPHALLGYLACPSAGRP